MIYSSVKDKNQSFYNNIKNLPKKYYHSKLNVDPFLKKFQIPNSLNINFRPYYLLVK